MLKSVILENYRNHKKFELILERVTILIGPNGVGKSNILEAISVLSSCRSFREEDKKNLVNFESAFGRIRGDNLEVFIQKEPFLLMKPKEKGVFKKQSAFVGTLKSVTFSPETMALITGTPKIRRRFLDLMISQRDKEYLIALMAYEKIRKERNSLLQRIRDRQAQEEELPFWDDSLAKEGGIIIEKRQQAIDFLNTKIADTYREISGCNHELALTYLKNDNLKVCLSANHDKEIWQARTLHGPHLDDVLIQLDGRNLANFASRGEIRTAVLAIKIGELNFLESPESQPILLLDDVFSEFDANRRSHLGQLISNYQTLITTTDRSHLSDVLLKEAKIVEL